MTAKEMALEYYPNLWNIERLRALVAVRKLTPEEYMEITGGEYAG